MFNKISRTVSLILSSAITISALCACNIPAGEPAESSLPTTAPKETETSVMTTPVTTVTETTISTTETEATAETTYETAPLETMIDTDYVKVFSDVTPEMLNADYWISKEDNRILMNAEQIEEFNHNNRAIIKTKYGTEMPLFDEFGDTFDGAVLREFLQENAESVPTDPSRYYLNGSRTTKSYWDNLIELSNMDAVEDEIKIHYGYTVKRMTLRLFPTEDRVFDGSSDQYFDFNLYSECMPFMPVMVLHESTDGEYLYVVFDSYSAWVRKDAVALCKDKDDWLARQNASQWLVVTAREIRLGDDPHLESTRDLVLPMGTYMELVPASEAPSEINQRTTYCDYVVKIPTRDSAGYINDEYVLIPVSDDVSAGFLPYTPANIVRQAFKLLGDRYGWGGDLRANDCTGIVREIYRCFGILMPRVGQSSVKGVCTTDMTDMSSSEKLDVITSLTPGSLLSFSGHIMIYIGTSDDIPYVISAVGTLVAPSPGNTDKLHPRSVILNSLYVRNRGLMTWLDIVKYAVSVKPE